MFQQNWSDPLSSFENVMTTASPTWEYDNDSVNYVKLLGEGGFSNVYEVHSFPNVLVNVCI